MDKIDKTKEWALIGTCTICGNIDAISMSYSREYERELYAPNRAVRKVTRVEAQALVKDLARCDHKKLIAELRREIEYLKSPLGEPFGSEKS